MKTQRKLYFFVAFYQKLQIPLGFFTSLLFPGIVKIWMYTSVYFIKRIETRIWTFGASGPRLLEKADPTPKLIVWVKKVVFDKFEGVDFKYENSFCKILTEKLRNKAFLVSILGIFVFAPNIVIRQIRWRCFSNL